jgi:hypothetical protein
LPFTASTASFGCPPRDPINLDDRHILRVASITEKEFPSWDDPEIKEMKAIWSFEVFTLQGTPIINAEGNIYQQEAFTRLNVHASKPGKPTSTARIYMEAVLGRDPAVAVAEGVDILRAAIGRYVYCLFDLKLRQDGGSKLAILRLTAIADQAGAAAAVANGIASASLPPEATADLPLAAAKAPAGLPF